MPSLCPAPLRPATQDEQEPVVGCARSSAPVEGGPLLGWYKLRSNTAPLGRWIISLVPTPPLEGVGVDRFHYSWAAEADEHLLLLGVGVDRSPYKWAAEADPFPHVFGGDHGLCVLTNRLLLAHHLQSL